jgi:NAD-dependent SIR2 family protein deacetylase
MKSHVAPENHANLVGEAAARKFSKARALAPRCGICSKTIFRWADAGWIQRYKVNRRIVLFDEAEVMAFIEKARVS